MSAIAAPDLLTDAGRFRQCVGSFPTGVTVVAAEHDGVRAGMTLNSFTSISLDPLLVAVSLAHGSRTLGVVRAGGRFTVSILGAAQREVALAFARPGAEFPAAHVDREAGGHVPVAGAIAVLRCAVADRVTAGDHDIVVGRVTGFRHDAGVPLLFHRGAFRELGAEAITTSPEEVSP